MLIVIAAAAAAGAAVATWRWVRLAPRAAGGSSWSPPPRPGAASGTDGTIVLDVAVTDPEAPAVRRLAEAIGHDTLAADPDLAAVVVTDAAGRELARVRRPDPLPTITIPDGAPELTPSRARQPSVVERPTSRRTTTMRPDDTPVATVHKDLTARFDLPVRVLDGLAATDDGTELVRAILAAAGRDVTVTHGVVRTGDEGVVVLGDAHGHGLSHDDLSAAFLRFQHSGARRGIAIVLGYVAPAELRRRQAMAPELVYVGPEALQRMADAVSLGADPLRFAAPVTPPR